MKRAVSLAAILSVALLSTSANAVKVAVGNDSALNFAVFMQPRVELDDGASPSGNAATEFYVRRARFNITGNMGKLIVFQLQADMPRLGRGGNYTNGFVWQDANIAFTPVEGLYLQAGFMVEPLSHGELGSSAAFNTMDILGNPIRMLSDSGLRETGFQIRYVGLEKKLNFRVGAFNGMRTSTPLPTGVGAATAPVPLNQDRVPKLAGYVQYSLLGAEPGETFNGLYFSETPIVSVGFGAQYMPNAVVTGTVAAPSYNNYTALAGSLFIELPMSSDVEVVGQGNVYKYGTYSGDANNGVGVGADLGVRFGSLEPVISLAQFSGDAHTKDYRRPAVGLNYYINKHAAKVQFEVAKEYSGDLTKAANTPVLAGGAGMQYILQAQMLFQ